MLTSQHYITYYNIMLVSPNIPNKELVALLTENNLFKKREAIRWCFRREQRMEKCRRVVRCRFEPSRKFISRMFEINLLFSCFIPPYDDAVEIPFETYDTLKALKRYNQLVRVYSVEGDVVSIIFPQIYDYLLHGYCTKSYVPIKSRYRYWTEFKYETLGPISNLTKEEFTIRTFVFPKILLDNLEGNIFQILSKFISQYVQNLGIPASRELYSRYIGRFNNIKSSDYTQIWKDTIKTQLEDLAS